MQGTSVDLSIEMGETCAIGSEKKTEMGNNCEKNPLNADSIDYCSEQNVFLA
jgi:hypothetical protein